MTESGKLTNMGGSHFIFTPDNENRPREKYKIIPMGVKVWYNKRWNKIDPDDAHPEVRKAWESMR